MKRKRCLVAVSLGLLTMCIPGCGGADRPAALGVGSVVPAFSLPVVAGGTGSLTSDQLRGKVTVLNFWSTSCSTCLKETEDLGRVHESGKAVVVGIALEQDPEYLRRFVAEKGIK